MYCMNLKDFQLIITEKSDCLTKTQNFAKYEMMYKV